MTPFMRRGNHYKLKAEVKSECQGFHFVYPKGTIVRLDDVYERDVVEERHYTDFDDEPAVTLVRTGTVLVYSFDTVPQGFCMNFEPDEIEPATPEEVKAARPTVREYPPGVSRRAV